MNAYSDAKTVRASLERDVDLLFFSAKSHVAAVNSAKIVHN